MPSPPNITVDYLFGGPIMSLSTTKRDCFRSRKGFLKNRRLFVVVGG